MKFFAVFAAILSVALGSQGSWTLHQLSEAIQSPYTDPALLPHLESALNEMMYALHVGQQMEAVAVTIPAIDLSSWTLAELSQALQNPATDAALIPYLEQALNQMMAAIVSEDTQHVTPVIVPAMDVTYWTLSELSEAYSNPATNPALVPYLEHGINEIAHALITGQQMTSIVLVIPSGLLTAVESPAPVPVVPAPVETPVEIPSDIPVLPTPPAPSSPLVQIIVNVNQQQSAGVAPAPVIVPGGVKPEPVIVVDQAPEPVIVVDTPTVVEPVQVVETPAIVEPVQVVETPAGVEPVIVGTPVIPVGVMPEVVPINPVDILHPVPVVQPVIVGAPIVGPIV